MPFLRPQGDTGSRYQQEGDEYTPPPRVQGLRQALYEAWVEGYPTLQAMNGKSKGGGSFSKKTVLHELFITGLEMGQPFEMLKSMAQRMYPEVLATLFVSFEDGVLFFGNEKIWEKK